MDIGLLTMEQQTEWSIAYCSRLFRELNVDVKTHPVFLFTMLSGNQDTVSYTSFGAPPFARIPSGGKMNIVPDKFEMNVREKGCTWTMKTKVVSTNKAVYKWSISDSVYGLVESDWMDMMYEGFYAVQYKLHTRKHAA